MRAILITEFGGPEVLTAADVPAPEPGSGQHLIQVARAGVNYGDTHQAEDSYLAKATLPLVPGAEVAGRLAGGRRVVALLEHGGYAERAVADPRLTFDVPDSVDDGAALALVLQGTTAWHLLRTSARLAAGESVVVHAAAGGVGSLAVQLARRFGAGRVIATASTADKRRLALDLGADVAIDPHPASLVEAVTEANRGRRVDVVLEMTGGGVTDASLAALAPFGRLVFYGMASRTPPTAVHPVELMRRSRGVIGFWLAHCMADPDRFLRGPMTELLELVAGGELRPVVGGTYPLGEAARAHADLRARRSVGKLLLDPTV